jgi:HlyD family secretion protein
VSLTARIAIASTLTALVGCDAINDEFAVGTIERERIDLVADSNEPIIAIRVREGDSVAPDEALLVQDDRRPSNQLAKALADRDLMLARLGESETGPRAQAIDRTRARLAGANSALATAKRELAREESLNQQSYASESRVNILRGEVDTAIAQQREITAELEELLEGTRSEQIDQARAAFRASNAISEDLQIAVDRATVRAPVAGVVESLPFELGERPAAGQTVVVILADGRTYARVHIPEPLRTRLRPGMPASLRIDGYVDEFSGTIRWISGEAAFTPYFALTQHDRSHLSYLAEIDLADAAELPAGIPVEARFPGLFE